MSTTRVRLPESLHEAARQRPDEEGISVHQLIARALPERISALDTAACLEARAVRSSREGCDAVLASVPDVPPLPRDELPPKLAPKRTRGVG